MQQIIRQLAAEIKVGEQQVRAAVELLDGGATVPFIARYRKEVTGGLDDIQLRELEARLSYLRELDERRAAVLKSIDEQGKLTDALRAAIAAAPTKQELEDIYLPYKPKRQTKAEIARKKGLEPLATLLMLQTAQDSTKAASPYVKGEVKDVREALQGARDIIAEWVNEDEQARNTVRNSFSRTAVISSKVVKGKEEEGSKYRNYFDFSESLNRCSSHRLLALRRGEAEGFLRVSISPDAEGCIERLNRRFVKGRSDTSAQVEEAVGDSFKRLLKPSIETEFANLSKMKADEEAIRVFSENLRQLLLSPPLGQKRVLGVDPGYRTGCKVVCLDAQGNLVHNEAIYPHPPQNE